jgi:multicomponent Na+:H+ antiporter subunit A
MIYLFVLIFGIGLIAPFLHRITGSWTGWLLALLPAGVFVYMLSFADPVLSGGETILITYPWLPGENVHLSFLVDGLSLFFALLISGIGTLIVLYGSGYLKGDPNIGRFYLSLLLFMGSMLGVVLANNLVALFVFWEGTSFTSYLLIGYEHENETARRNALQALLVTGLGGLAMFAGFMLMSIAGGSFELSVLMQEPETLTQHYMYAPILILITAGAITKSAQFPFHFWLPNAMVAPTPVSAYLHSATMVKAGVYLLARLLPLLGGTALWTGLIVPFGAVTMAVTAWLALCYTDLKQILAYSTLMILGLLVMLIGMGEKYAIKATVIMILAHALYKGTLFMVAGAVDHEAGSRDITELDGLIHEMPFTGTAACVAALSMAGIIPLIGFIGKETVLEATLHTHAYPILLTGVTVFASIGVIVAAGLVSVYPFFGRELQAPSDHTHEAPLTMWLGPVVLAGLSLLFGLWSSLIDHSLLSAAATSMTAGGKQVDLHLALWHGVNTPLLLSLLSIVLAVAVYVFWNTLREGRLLRGFRTGFGWAPDRSYDYAIKGLKGAAHWQTRYLQTGQLRHYLVTIFCTLVVLVGATLLGKTNLVQMVQQLDTGSLQAFVAQVYYYEWLIVLLLISGAFAAVAARTKLAAVISLGIAGFSVALLYMMYSAPDLAITQILVETLTVIVIALVMVYLPVTPDDYEVSGRRVRDAIIAGTSGLLVTTLVIMVVSLPFDPVLQEFFVKNSYKEAYGMNIVNVILVDFRAFDTLGEITVLGTAAVGVYALINLSPGASDDPEEEHTDEANKHGEEAE